MEFKVQFGTERPVSMNERTAGINQLDMVRKESRVEKLSHHYVTEYISGRGYAPTIPIPEKIARSSGHFGDHSKITVKVPKGGLNRYVHDQVRFTRSPEDGAIKSAKIEQKLEEDEVVKAWIKAGCPLEWNPEEKVLNIVAMFVHGEIPEPEV